MAADPERLRATANHTRYQPGQRRGHYESYFLRANHPVRPLAFWIRYTIFSPHRRPEDAIGELWAVYFDGERQEHTAVKREVPLAQCTFSPSAFLADVAGARLEPGKATGSAASTGHEIGWTLDFSGAESPLLLLPPALYGTAVPKAKSLVSLPFARFSGRLDVDGQRIDIADWVGSQNHNWGSQHTDHYAWGQVAGFDAHPDSFLEIGTARLKFGPFWTPFMTVCVLRHRGEEFALNSVRQLVRAHGTFDYFTWRFRTETAAVQIIGTIAAPREAFVGLRYYNPPGGIKHCLNSKLASCEIRVTDKRHGGAPEILSTVHRAAFEILTDDQHHGIELRA